MFLLAICVFWIGGSMRTAVVRKFFQNLVREFQRFLEGFLFNSTLCFQKKKKKKKKKKDFL
jgi:hypothetical protein